MIKDDEKFSKKKEQQNKSFLEKSRERFFKKFREKKLWKLKARGVEGNVDHYYDDDIVETISEEFTDRITVAHLIGDIIRSLGGLLGRRPELTDDEFHLQVLEKIYNDKKISRKDVGYFTKILPTGGNSIIPFMNGGSLGEHWNTSPNGFYDWIDNKSSECIIGIELGFKADEYGREVSRRLIEKKRANPDMYVGLLIDGFVSLLMVKPETLDDFQNNTLTMINDMKEVGIDVRVNDSWNPLTSDFLAANHVKLWIFDGKAAFIGGIGIESQFISTLYDQMDLIEGPFVRTLTLMSFLLFANQRRNLVDSGDEIEQIYEMDRKKLKTKFLPELENKGNVTMEISMNVPGYVQDAQKDYYRLLLDEGVQEIFIMAPYFSDDKIARSLVLAAKKLETKEEKKALEQIKRDNPNISNEDLEELVTQQLESNKKVHVIFPKKHENAIIAEVSKYYAYYMRKNRIVETKQFAAKDGDITHEMLHAKQMVVVLEKAGKIKYIKFGGSYNPAGRAHNMWEVNNISYLNSLNDHDSDSEENPIRDYLNKVFWKIVNENSEPFRWGQKDVKLNVLELFIMKFAQMLFF